MNDADRAEAKFLRTLSSAEAATFLLENYARGYPATIRHRSWDVEDQFRLARQFLKGHAHASPRPYEDFLSFMSLDNFLAVVLEGLRDIPKERLDLLAYHLLPLLRRTARNGVELSKVNGIAERLLSPN